MSNLWDLSHIQPETRVVLEGDTIPALFWNGVAQRHDKVWICLLYTSPSPRDTR